MPTLLRESGFRFHFFSLEGTEPPHVHVDKGGASAKFWLQPIALTNNRSHREVDLRRIHRIIEEHQTKFLEQWHEYFDS